MSKFQAVLVLIVIMLILIWPHYKYMNIYHKNLPAVSVNEIVPKLRTGDIVMMKYETPCFYNGPNGSNTSIYFGKAIADSIQYYSQGHFTHAGVIMVVNNVPYVFHLTDDPNKDEYTGKYVSGTPALCSTEFLQSYRGNIYLLKHSGNVNVDTMKVIKNIYSRNVMLEGTISGCVWNNGLKFGKNSDNKYMCTDFVEDVLSQLGILSKPTRNQDIVGLIKRLSETNYYNINPTIIKTGWYENIYDKFM